MTAPFIPLGTQEWADIRSTAQAALTDSCQIQRAVKTSDGAGSESLSWSTVATVAAKISTPTGGYIGEMASRLSEQASFQVSLPNGTDVRVTDRLVIDSQTLTVQAVYDPQTYSSLVRVLASELR